MSVHVRPGIEICNLTNVGCERAENQDYFGYFEPESDDEFEKKGRLAVVADGMGGHAGGDVASRLAVEMILQTYKEHSSLHPTEILKLAFERANAEIVERARQQAELAEMGSTCTALALQNGHAYFAHVGDSRAYLIRDNHILKLTRDHSVVEEMIAEGLIQREEALNHPQKNVITRALGMGPQVNVDVSQMPIPLYVGDAFLVCSDGLTGLVSDQEIRAIIVDHSTAGAGRQLLDLALNRGGYDNITIQILRVTGGDRRDLRTTKPDEISLPGISPVLPKKRRIKRSVIILFIALLIAFGGALLILRSSPGVRFLRRLKAHFVSGSVRREANHSSTKGSESKTGPGPSQQEKDKTTKEAR